MLEEVAAHVEGALGKVEVIDIVTKVVPLFGFRLLKFENDIVNEELHATLFAVDGLAERLADTVNLVFGQVTHFYKNFVV